MIVKRNAVRTLMLAIVLFLLTCPCTAADTGEQNAAADGPVLSELVPDILKDHLIFKDQDDLADAVKQTSDVFQPSKIGQYVASSLAENAKTVVRSFSILFAILAIDAILSVVRTSFGTAANIVEYLCLILLVWYGFELVKPCILNLQNLLTTLSEFMAGMFPAMTMLYAAGSEVVSAQVSGLTAVAVMNFIQAGAVYFIFPAAKAIIALFVVNAVSDLVDLTGVINFIRTLCLWAVGLAMTLFTGVLYFQSVISASADSLASRSIRFAASNFIPVVGGLVGESLKTVVTSVNVVKGVTGSLGVAAILYLAIPPVAAVLVVKLFLTLSAGAAQMMKLTKEHAFLNGIGGVFNILLALVFAVVFVFIVMLSIFMKAVSA